MGVLSRHYAIKIYFEDTETQYLNKFCTFTTKDAKWAEALNGENTALQKKTVELKDKTRLKKKRKKELHSSWKRISVVRPKLIHTTRQCSIKITG